MVRAGWRARHQRCLASRCGRDQTGPHASAAVTPGTCSLRSPNCQTVTLATARAKGDQRPSNGRGTDRNVPVILLAR